MTRASKSGIVRIRHCAEFRAEALKLAQTVGVSAAARQLGLHASQLPGWRAKAELLKSRGQIDQEMARENARLRRELAEKEQERAFLGQAAAYFAKGRKRSTP